MIDTLVIACGNPLRGDDGIALVAADSIVTWPIPGVRIVCVHQLVPELIEEMKSASKLIVLDAAIDIVGVSFQVRELEPKQSRRHFGHHQTPENLLAILAELENHLPQAWLVSIRAESFNHGDPVTDAAGRHAGEALHWLHEFLLEPSCTKLG